MDTVGRLEKLVPNEALVNVRLTLNAVTPHPQVFETTFGREVSASAGLFTTRAKIPHPRCHTLLHSHFRPFSCGSANCTPSTTGLW